jgi:sialidase-1
VRSSPVRAVSALLTVVVFSASAHHGLAQTPSEADAQGSSSIGAEGSFELQDLFESMRIPNIVVAADGSVLAFARSGRLLRRSEDGGRSWSSIQEVGDDAGGSAIVDDNTGDVMVVSAHRAHLWRSPDNGRTWSREAIVIKPNPMGHGTPDGVPVHTACSESGITLRHGKHQGRLLMPARIQPPKGNNDQEWWPYNYNTAIYSDDGGKTWQTSGPVQSGTGEGTLAELSTGDIYYNSRSHMSVDHRRRIAWSHDGGAMFVDWRVSEHLYEVGEPFYFKYGTQPSYGCNAGLVRLPLEVTDGKDVLLFSTPDSPGGPRIRMTVWASFDRGETWPVKRLVYEGPSAYSSLAAGRDGMVYLLFERGLKKLYDRIAVARFNLAWLAGDDWEMLLKD